MACTQHSSVRDETEDKYRMEGVLKRGCGKELTEDYNSPSHCASLQLATRHQIKDHVRRGSRCLDTLALNGGMLIVCGRP